MSGVNKKSTIRLPVNNVHASIFHLVQSHNDYKSTRPDLYVLIPVLQSTDPVQRSSHFAQFV